MENLDLIEEFFNNWIDGNSYIFTYKRLFLPNEYITIKKDGSNYKLVEEASTKVISPISKDILQKMMQDKELVHKASYGYYANVRNLKTDGCSCGLWALGPEAGKHSTWCEKSRGY